MNSWNDTIWYQRYINNVMKSHSISKPRIYFSYFSLKLIKTNHFPVIYDGWIGRAMLRYRELQIMIDIYHATVYHLFWYNIKILIQLTIKRIINPWCINSQNRGRNSHQIKHQTATPSRMCSTSKCMIKCGH